MLKFPSKCITITLVINLFYFLARPLVFLLLLLSTFDSMKNQEKKIQNTRGYTKKKAYKIAQNGSKGPK